MSAASQKRFYNAENNLRARALEDLPAVVAMVIPDPNSGEREVPLPALKRGDDFIFFSKTGKSEEAPDEKELKGIATDIVVDDFFASKDTLFHFMQIVYKTFADAIDIYRTERNLEVSDVVFVYKGGNVLRIVANEFILELPNAVADEVQKYFSPYFKRSDADFSIYLNPAVADYDEIYEDLTLLSYILQIRLREIFTAHPTKFFSFYRYSKAYQGKILQKYLPKLNASSFITSRSRDGRRLEFTQLSYADAFANATAVDEKVYDTVRDQAVQTVVDTNAEDDAEGGESEQRKVLYYLSRDGDAMPIRYNDAVEIETNNLMFRFALVRTKLNFTTVLTERKDGKTTKYVKNIGGELIDVSLPHRTDVSVGAFFETLSRNVLLYNLAYDGKSLSFYSLSPEYLIHDLEKILFAVSNLPWEDRKYQKRIHRIVYLGFIDLFIKMSSNAERRRFLQALITSVYEPLQESAYDVVSSLSRVRAPPANSDILFAGFVDKLIGVARKLRTVEDKAEFQRMMAVLIEDTEVLIGALDNLDAYTSAEGTIARTDLEDGSFKSLI